MEHLHAAAAKGDRLAYIVDILTALSDIAGHAGSPLLKYFLELAAAQARDEQRVVADQVCEASASRMRVVLQ